MNIDRDRGSYCDEPVRTCLLVRSVLATNHVRESEAFPATDVLCGCVAWNDGDLQAIVRHRDLMCT